MVCLYRGLVPRLAVFAAAANASYGVDTTHVQPSCPAIGEVRCGGKAEAAIGVKDRWIGAVQLQALFVGYENRNCHSVKAAVN